MVARIHPSGSFAFYDFMKTTPRVMSCSDEISGKYPVEL